MTGIAQIRQYRRDPAAGDVTAILQSGGYLLFYFLHVNGRLEARDNLAFPVDEELCEVPSDVCLVTVLLVVGRCELVESGILQALAETVERLL